MMCMANCNCKRIRRIGIFEFGLRKQHLYHMLYLPLVGMPRAHHCLLDGICRIFSNLDS